jgi:hypothetical protein
MDVRLVELRLAARADCADCGSFGDHGTLQHVDRAEMDERDRIPVVGADRQRLAAAGYRAGEGDDSPGRCSDRRT